MLAAPMHAEETGSGNTAELLERLQEAAAAHENVQFALEQSISVMGQTIHATGRVTAEGDRMAMHMQMQMPNGMALDQQTVTTADTSWTYMPAMNMVSKIDLARLRAEAPGLPQAQPTAPYNFAETLDGEAVTHLGPEEVDGTPTEHFVARLDRIPFAQGQSMPGLPPDGRTDIWLSPTDGLPRRIEIHDGKGTRMFTQRFHNVVVNAEIPEQTFEFTPPEGAQVIDMTDALIQMAQQGGMPGAMPGPGGPPPTAAPPTSAPPETSTD